MAKGSGSAERGGGQGALSGTTATLRNAAREAAEKLDYARAVKLMSAAIERYPESPGPLRKQDISNMTAQIREWAYASYNVGRPERVSGRRS